MTLDLNKLVKGLSITGSGNIRMRHHKKIERQTHVTMYDRAGETKTYDGLPDYSLGTGAVKTETKDDDNWLSI